MTQIITIEFTDAQWALIEANYPKYADEDGVFPDVTPEVLSGVLMQDVKSKTTEEIQHKASITQKDAFDV